MAKKYVGIGPKLAVSPIERLSNRELFRFSIGSAKPPKRPAT